MAIRLALAMHLICVSFRSAYSRDFLQASPSVGKASSDRTADTLNKFYSSGTGLIVSLMHDAFTNESMADGVPVWACEDTTSPNCTWHAGKKYASATWISWDLYGPLGVELYKCNPDSCDDPNLLLIYDPSTTVVGAAYLADANTDIDTAGMEGVSKTFTPPACSEAAQICEALKPTGSDFSWTASCLKQAGGDVGKAYHDPFSSSFGGVLEGTLMPYGSEDTPPNFTHFVSLQKQSFQNFSSIHAFHPGCPKDVLWPNCTCNAGGYGYNEILIRTANKHMVCSGNGMDSDKDSCEENYRAFYCANQLPIALAYVGGAEGKDPKYLAHYQEQIRKICKRTDNITLVRFDFTNKGKKPFVAVEA